MGAPPFRAEHVGSLLRPEKLLKARAAIEGDQYRTVAKSTMYAELKSIEDEAIRDAVKLQEQAGLQSITDGEFRRPPGIRTSCSRSAAPRSPSSTPARRSRPRCRSRTPAASRSSPAISCR